MSSSRSRRGDGSVLVALLSPPPRLSIRTTFPGANLTSPPHKTACVSALDDHNCSFNRLYIWWNGTTTTAVHRMEMAGQKIIRSYFQNVERLADLLTVDEAVQKEQSIAAAGGGAGGDSGSGAMAYSPIKSTRTGSHAGLRAYAPDDPLWTTYRAEVEANQKGLNFHRAHILDSKLAPFALLDVSHSSHAAEFMGKNGEPRTVANVVRKAMFANARSTAHPLYPHDEILDQSRVATMALIKDVDVGPTQLDTLIDAIVETGENKLELTFLLRKAQAHRYAAQWARAHILLNTDDETTVETMHNRDRLAGALWQDATAAMKAAEEAATAIMVAGAAAAPTAAVTALRRSSRNIPTPAAAAAAVTALRRSGRNTPKPSADNGAQKGNPPKWDLP